MIIHVVIPRNSIHHYIDVPVDPANPEGEKKWVVQLDMMCPEYPNLPTYGLRIDFPDGGPITKAALEAAKQARCAQIKAQMERDAAARQQAEDWGLLEQDVEV